MGDDSPTSTHSVYFRYSSYAGDTTFHCLSCGGIACTDTDTGIVVSSNTIYNLKIKMDGNQARYMINGSAVCTINTNLPGPNEVLKPLQGLTNGSNAVARGFGFSSLILTTY